jgi:hypothetical protein
MKVLEQNDFNFPVRCDAELGDSEPEDWRLPEHYTVPIRTSN